MNALKELTTKRDEIVTDYDGGSERIMRASDVTSAVSPFPGGSGFLSGEPGPRRLMILGHNYDGSDNADKPEDYRLPFWKSLRLYVAGVGLREDEVFVTNLLMGRKPGKAAGAMAHYCSEEFVRQCIVFLNEQIRIVKPEVVAVCGLEILPLLDRWTPPTCRRVDVTHPSAVRGDFVRPASALRSVNSLREAFGLARIGLEELTSANNRVNYQPFGHTRSTAIREAAPSRLLGAGRDASPNLHGQLATAAGSRVELALTRTKRNEKRPWTGLWHVNAGTHERRSWEDQRRYGFLSAGYGAQWRDEMRRLSLGDEVFAYINGAGYCGGGHVISAAVRADQFVPSGGTAPLSELPLISGVWFHDANDDELAEYMIGVAWNRTVSEIDGLKVRYAIRGTVRRIYDPGLALTLRVTFG
jgi:hypothetical protein